MLAVRKDRRKRGLGTRLVVATIEAMIAEGCQEVVLEAEVTNHGALQLYQNLGFIRDKLLEKYYLNGNDAYRLKLRLSSLPVPSCNDSADSEQPPPEPASAPAPASA